MKLAMMAAMVVFIGCMQTINPHSAYAQEQNGISTSGSSSVDPSRVKDELRTILSKPEFNNRPPPDNALSKTVQSYSAEIESTWNDVNHWATRWYKRFKELFSGGGGALASTSFIFVCVFIGACILTAVYLLTRYILEYRKSRGRRTVNNHSSSEVLEYELEAAMTRTVEEWLSEADLLAGQSDYRAAIRARFRVVLLRLDAAGLLESSRTETNGDYSSVRLSHSISNELASAFRRLVRDFDFLWYGEHNADRLDYDRSTKDCEIIAESIKKLNNNPTMEKADALVTG